MRFSAARYTDEVRARDYCRFRTNAMNRYRSGDDGQASWVANNCWYRVRTWTEINDVVLAIVIRVVDGRNETSNVTRGAGSCAPMHRGWKRQNQTDNRDCKGIVLPLRHVYLPF